MTAVSGWPLRTDAHGRRLAVLSAARDVLCAARMTTRTRISLSLISLSLLAVAATGCGPETRRLEGGNYVAASSLAGTALEGATLSVDLTAKTATLTPASGTAVTLTLSPIAEASWPRECPTNLSSTIVEAFTIAPDPLEVAGLSLPSPVLKAGCGSSTKEVFIDAAVTSGQSRFVFTASN